MTHPTTRVTLKGRRWANIDDGLVETIKLCWAAGIPTHGSCQGGSPNAAEMMIYGGRADYAYIAFGDYMEDDPTPADAASMFIRALTLPDEKVRLHNPECFLARVRGYTLGRPFWYWHARPSAHGESGRLLVSAHFPSSDIQEINARLGWEDK